MAKKKNSLTLNTKILPISDLKEYEKNAVIHDTENVSRIKSLIDDFGYLVPIIVDKDNIIIAGHGRLAALKEQGVEEVEVVLADDLNALEANSFRLLENKLHEYKKLDNSILTEVYLELKEQGANFLEDYNIDMQEVWQPDVEKFDSVEEKDENTKKIIKLQIEPEHYEDFLDELKNFINGIDFNVSIQ